MESGRASENILHPLASVEKAEAHMGETDMNDKNEYKMSEAKAFEMAFVEPFKDYEQSKIISAALWKYGKEYQVWKFIEELGELITAMARMRQAELRPDLARENELDNLVEEFADSGITADEMISCYGLKDRIRSMRSLKLKRLEKRMAGDRDDT